MQTNRDFYLNIAELISEQGSSALTLEEYLRALWELGREYQEQPVLSVEAFFEMLSKAFTVDVPPFDESWRKRYASAPDNSVSGFEGWQATILNQIVDLREMDEQDVLKNKLRYFGVSSPQGGYWYNFDPCTFLECATAGTWGGWQPGDGAGRRYVHESVLVAENGRVEESDPTDIPNPVYEVSQVKWDDFQHFLRQGQWYE